MLVQWGKLPKAVFVCALLAFSLTLTSCGSQRAPEVSPLFPFCQADDAEVHQEQVASQSTKASIELIIWGLAPGQKCWRVLSLVTAAEQITNNAVKVNTHPFSMREGPFTQTVSDAFATRIGPDIVTGLKSGPLVALAKQGHLAPLDECLSQHDSFEQVYEELWDMVRWDNHIWGIPLDMTVTPFFYHKGNLRKLGWSEAQIEELPQEIQAGRFTLKDVVTVSEDAIAEGVVEAGFGFWPHTSDNGTFWRTYNAFGGLLWNEHKNRFMLDSQALKEAIQFRQTIFESRITPTGMRGGPNNTWLNRNLWRETTASGKVLFWHLYGDNWSQWRFFHTAHLGGEQYLSKNVGVAPFPSGIYNEPGLLHVFHVTFYGVAHEVAANPTRYDAVCELLAEATTPQIQARIVRHSAEFPVLKNMSSHAEFANDSYVSQLYNLAKRLKYDRDEFSDFGQYISHFNKMKGITMDEVRSADLTGRSSDETVRVILGAIQAELGEQVLIK